MAAGARGRVGEFGLIARYFRPLASDPGTFALTDDAARFRPKAGEELVVTTDLLAEGVHFLAEDAAASIARKALRVNLSDLAAKGADPAGYLLAIALPKDWTEDWVRKFANGLKGDQDTYGIALLGGDTSRAAGGLTIVITAIGHLPKGRMVRRKGARPGDLVFVSGTVGDAALGLRLRLGSIDGAPAGKGAKHLLDRYLHPQPRTRLAPVLRRFATSALDVSDGLVGDLGHICEESGVAATIEAAAVPLSRPATALVATDPSALVTVLTGGDDYEILSTVPPRSADAYAAAATAAGVPVTRIGTVTRGKAPPRVVGADGKDLELASQSWDHFGKG
ncbi:MAG: thiamine-phosphate kinase [Bauldia sp.]